MDYYITLLIQELLNTAKGYAQAAIAGFTIGGKLNLGTPNRVGHLPPVAGGTGHEDGAEPPLGNPAANGYVLSSTTLGVRSWVPPGTPDPDDVRDAGRWEPTTNGDPDFPELTFDLDGDVVMGWIEGPL